MKSEDLRKIIHEEYLRKWTDKEGSWKWNEDGSVDVEGNLSIFNYPYSELPFQFNYVSRSFLCTQNRLTTLKGAPRIVGQKFDCANNLLTSLKYSPKITQTFNCYGNLLENLEGSPEKIEGSFICSNNRLTSLNGAPKEVIGCFKCRNNSIWFTENDVKKVSVVNALIIT